MVDASHPDLAGSIVGQFDAVTVADKPDEHGTGMTGAIAAHRKLLGVAPRARIFAIHAFSTNAQSQQATSQAIVAGIDWAIGKGARVINMSFAGPYDPILQVYLKKAHEHGIVLVAAAGNAGPQSPPLYPAADENVIAVTAVDEHDKLLSVANQGPHIALAAPGVNVIEVGPRGTYNLTTGTSVASAHVSGVAALILERNPKIDVATLENVLYSTAKDLGAPGRDSEFGYGLVDPYRALEAAEAPDLKVATAAPPKPSAADGPVMPVVATAAPDKSRFAPRRAPAPASVATEAAPPSEATAPEAAPSPPAPPQAAPTETAAAPETAHADPAPRAPKRRVPASASKPAPAKVAANPDGPLDSSDLPNMTPPQPPQSAPHAPPAAAYPPPGASYAPPGGPYAPPSSPYAPPAALPMGPNAPVAPPYPARGMAPGPEPEDLAAIIVRKRLACRNEGFNRGVRGSDMLEYIASCVSEARLACARQVVAQRVRPYDRREFMSRCLLGVTAADAGR